MDPHRYDGISGIELLAEDYHKNALDRSEMKKRACIEERDYYAHREDSPSRKRWLKWIFVSAAIFLMLLSAPQLGRFGVEVGGEENCFAVSVLAGWFVGSLSVMLGAPVFLWLQRRFG